MQEIHETEQIEQRQNQDSFMQPMASDSAAQEEERQNRTLDKMLQEKVEKHLERNANSVDQEMNERMAEIEDLMKAKHLEEDLSEDMLDSQSKQDLRNLTKTDPKSRDHPLNLEGKSDELSTKQQENSISPTKQGTRKETDKAKDLEESDISKLARSNAQTQDTKEDKNKKPIVPTKQQGNKPIALQITSPSA